MTPFVKEFNISTNNYPLIIEKVKTYFIDYNFKIKEKNNKLIFFKKFSFFGGWQINPLNWESEVEVSFSNNILKIKYTNFGNSTSTPLAFSKLFNSFFNNLELHLSKSINYSLNIEKEIKKAKQRVLLHFLIIILGICLFFAIGKTINKELNTRHLDNLFIIIGAIVPLKLINQYWIQKNA